MERAIENAVRALSWMVVITGLVASVASVALFARTDAPTILLFTALSLASTGYALHVGRRHRREEGRPIERVVNTVNA